ncbi:MAG TPA: DnaA/Hda family protein, partial [Orrella sp.]
MVGSWGKRRAYLNKRNVNQKRESPKVVFAAQCVTMAKLQPQIAILRLERMAQQLILDILPSPDPTLQNMVPGGNGALIAAIQTLLPGHTLYAWGPDGSGRTHLLRASCAFHGGIYIDTNAATHNIQALIESMVAGHGIACVAVDDVQTLDDSGLAALFGLYNRWRECAGGADAFRLLVAGDRAPLQMPCREDVRTRLGWGAVYRLEPLSDDEKFDALMHHAKARGMPLSEDVLRWLLTHGSRDIRALFAALDALDRYALAN